MKTNPFIEVWPSILLFDLLRYIIPATLAFVIFWKIGRKHWWHLFIQRNFPKSSQLWKEFGYSMSTVVIFSLVGYSIYSAERAGMTRIYYNVADFGIGYLIFSFIVMVVYHDFYFYWTHRLMHHKAIFKHVHKVHHESKTPSPWAAYSFHPWEALIQAMVLPIALFILPLHGLSVFAFVIYMIVRNVIGHLGFEILPKGFTKNKWVNWNTAITHHDLHHQYFNYNYGLYFSWWDKWMKTEHSQYHEIFDEVKSRPKAADIKSQSKTVTNTLTIIVLLISFNCMAQSVAGKWMTRNEATGSPLSIIEITESSKTIEGKVTRIFLEPYQGDDPVCSKCEGDIKNKKVIGMNFLWGFKQEGSSWSSGKILDPESGEIYTCKLWLEDKNTLKVRGYAGAFDLFFRTQTWKRDGAVDESSLTGTWRTIDDHWNQAKSLVEIKNVNGELRGYIRKIYLLPHEGTDPVCTECEGSSKNTKIIGMKILWGFAKNGDDWEDGKILDPGNGNVYSSSIGLVDSNTLKVRGYIGPFYRSQVWTRMKY